MARLEVVWTARWEFWSMKLLRKGMLTEQELRSYRKIEQSLKAMSGTLRRHRADMDIRHLSDLEVSPVCCEYTQVLGFCFVFLFFSALGMEHTRQTLYYHRARAPRLTGEAEARGLELHTSRATHQDPVSNKDIKKEYTNSEGGRDGDCWDVISAIGHPSPRSWRGQEGASSWSL